MTAHPSSPTTSLEFSIQEGAELVHHELLHADQTLQWSVLTDYGYDIDFSIRAKSKVNGCKGTWIIFEPERIINREGYIEASVLADDGILLPVVIEFQMDNTYSWFNSKRVSLNVKRVSEPCQEEPEVVHHPQTSDSSVSRPASPAKTFTETTESRRLRDSKARIDLLWLNQVVNEAIVRCPDTIPAVRQKLTEVKDLLKPHVPDATSQAVI